MKRARGLCFGLMLVASLATTVAIRPRLETFQRQIARRPRPLVSGPITLGPLPAVPARAVSTCAVSTFRGGPERTGAVEVVPGAPIDLRSAWRRRSLNFDLHGAAKATPAVDASGVYVGADTGQFQKFDREGRPIWSFFVHTLERGIHATALLTEDTVYFGAYDGWFYALDKATGRPRWTISLGKVIGSSAVLWENALYVTVETEQDGFVAKLDPVDGRVVWCSEFLGQQAHSSPTIDARNGLAIVGSNAANVTALDLATGVRRWTYRTPKQNKGTGALVRGLYVFGGTDGNVFALAAATGRLAWVASVGGRILGNVTIDETLGLGFISSATGLAAFDLASGSVRWRWNYAGANSTRGLGAQTPVVLEFGHTHRLLAQCAPRQLCVMDPLSGAAGSRFVLSGSYSGSPTLDRGRLFVAYVDQGLEAFDFRYGSTR